MAEGLREPFDELMNKLAPKSKIESTQYLHGYLYPPWFILEARELEDTGHIRPHSKVRVTRQEIVHPGDYVDGVYLWPHLSPLLDLNLNKYSSRQIQVLAQTSRLVPSKVLVDGNVYFFKPWVSGHVHGYHESKSHNKILTDTSTSPPLAEARICRLHGLVSTTILTFFNTIL